MNLTERLESLKRFRQQLIMTRELADKIHDDGEYPYGISIQDFDEIIYDLEKDIKSIENKLSLGEFRLRFDRPSFQL